MSFEEEWRSVLTEYVIYDLLFKSLARDANVIEQVPTKLRYAPFMQKLSLLAEKQHHHYRRELGKLGCKVIDKQTHAGEYYVQVKVRGYVREAIYNSEVLRSECEVRLEKMIEQAIK